MVSRAWNWNEILGAHAWYLDAGASALVQACEKLTGHAAGAVDFGTEGPFLSRLGCDTVILGPGDIAQAHKPDEFLALDRIELLGIDGVSRAVGRLGQQGGQRAVRITQCDEVLAASAEAAEALPALARAS